MSFFRKADEGQVKHIATPDGSDWIELYSEFSKKKINQVILSAPKTGEDLHSSLAFIERFFEISVKDWSFVDAQGHKVPPTVENYRELAAEPAGWIDKILVEHLQNTIGRNVEDLEGKDSN